MARFWGTISYGPFFIFLAAVLWGLDGILRRSLFSTLSPITIVFYEHVIGAILIAPFFFRAAMKERLRPREWAAILWVSLLSGVLGTLWFTTALAQTNFISFSVVFLLQNLEPLFAVGAAALFLRERLSRKYLAWAALALLAGYFVTFPGGVVNLDTGQGTAMAALFAVGAAFAWGSSTALSRYTLLGHSHTFITGLRFWITALLALPIVFILGRLAIPAQPHLLVLPSPENLSRLLLIAFSSGLLALWIYYRGLKHTQAKVATIVELAFPLTAVAIDAFLYRTFLMPSQYLAAVVLLFAMYRVSRLNLGKTTIHAAGVEPGKGRGQSLNFPTLNLRIPETLDARYGIYAGWVAIGAKRYPAAIHYGSIPVFREREAVLEAHLIDASLGEPPEKVYFELTQYIRPIQNFENPKELEAQIGRDVAKIRQILRAPTKTWDEKGG